MEIQYGPYSASRLDTAACPYRFKRQYIDRDIKDPGSDASRRGNVVHETFEKITEGWIDEQPLKWEQVEEILTSKLTEYQITSREDKVLCVGATKCYMNNPPEMLESIFGIEEHLAVKWEDGKFVECDYNDDKAVYRGKIDLLAIDGQRARIIDHKTQPYIEKAANTFQMGGYAWLVKLHYPQVKEVETVLHYCRPELNFYSHPFLWEEDALKNVEAEIKMEISMAENLTMFNANPNFYCKYCPCQLECPVLPEIKSHATALGDAKKGPIMSAHEAQTTAGEINVVEEAVANLKKHLQNFVKEVGPVQIHGKEYNYFPSDSYEVKESVDKKAILEILGNVGLDPYSYVKIDVTALKKLWKTLDPSKLEAIKEHLTPTKKTSFRGKKV
jgi:RecB family exonuclease